MLKWTVFVQSINVTKVKDKGLKNQQLNAL